ncbi:hypothetical protein DFH11DRAFT_1546401 [Phellopilus nigrolimitatus]|nr:hypothetical protein DFH11DRAFT_1546401 [Phellopilus nigrolimitatus]
MKSTSRSRRTWCAAPSASRGIFSSAARPLSVVALGKTSAPLRFVDVAIPTNVGPETSRAAGRNSYASASETCEDSFEETHCYVILVSAQGQNCQKRSAARSLSVIMLGETAALLHFVDVAIPTDKICGTVGMRCGDKQEWGMEEEDRRESKYSILVDRIITMVMDKDRALAASPGWLL